MTTPSWPSDVPQEVQISSYSETPERNIAQFDPEVGPSKIRRRSSISTTMYSVTIVMTHDQFDSFLSFYRDDTADGSLTFTRKNPRDLLGPDYEFQFTTPPSYQARGPDFGEVSMTLKQMP